MIRKLLWVMLPIGYVLSHVARNLQDGLRSPPAKIDP